MLPTGTRIAFTSGPAYQDHNRIWAVLDKVLTKYPDMVLFHGGNPTGGEHIASLWARARKIRRPSSLRCSGMRTRRRPCGRTGSRTAKRISPSDRNAGTTAIQNTSEK